MSDKKDVTITDCTDCPCRNKDYESGSECNLGYDMEYLAKQDIYSSNNCQIISLKFINGVEFKTKTLNTPT